MCELAAGQYRVPDQVDGRIADLCVAQGMGRMVEDESALASAPVDDQATFRRRRGKRRKGPAPENKLAHAPENKQALF